MHAGLQQGRPAAGRTRCAPGGGGWGLGLCRPAISTRTGEGLEALRDRTSANPESPCSAAPPGWARAACSMPWPGSLQLRVGRRLRAAAAGPSHHPSRRAVSAGSGRSGGRLPRGSTRPRLPSRPAGPGGGVPGAAGPAGLQALPLPDCRHQGEPGCAVGDGWDRHGLYGRCLQEVETWPGRRPAAVGPARGPAPAGRPGGTPARSPAAPDLTTGQASDGGAGPACDGSGPQPPIPGRLMSSPPVSDSIRSRMVVVETS